MKSIDNILSNQTFMSLGVRGGAGNPDSQEEAEIKRVPDTSQRLMVKPELARMLSQTGAGFITADPDKETQISSVLEAAKQQGSVHQSLRDAFVFLITYKAAKKTA